MDESIVVVHWARGHVLSFHGVSKMRAGRSDDEARQTTGAVTQHGFLVRYLARGGVFLIANPRNAIVSLLNIVGHTHRVDLVFPA